MSSRQQESAAARQAPKLPQFPARKSVTSTGQSPTRRNRIDSLPGVPTTGRSPGRPDPARWERTGAAKLIQIQRRNDAVAVKDDACEDEAGGVEGFESPQLAKARAQVARNEVLSYMHHRRYQRKDTVERVDAPAEPRDTSFDYSDVDDDRARAPVGGRAADAQAAERSPADPTQLLHRVQQALERWPPGRPAQQHPHTFGDDDLRPTSADQSPTRHARSYFEESAGSLSLAAPPVVASGGPETASYSRGGGADSSTAVSRAGPGLRSTAGQGHLGHSQLGSLAMQGALGSLSEDAFGMFKREVAARVIQTHWRRWQNWKSKVRRDAEERILQQLLSDDSGLSLRLLLSGGGSNTEQLGGGAMSRESAGASSAASVQPSVAVRPASAHVPGSHSNPPIQLGRPVQHGRPSSGGAGPGGLSGRLAEGGRHAQTRPASAGTAMAQSRGKSPARLGRVTAPAVVASSPARGGRVMPGKPPARGDAGTGRGMSFDFDDVSEDSQRAAVDAGEASVQPSRRHADGHSVYTFIATPQKQATLTDATAASSGADMPTEDSICQRPTSSESDNATADRPAGTIATTSASQPATLASSDRATFTSDSVLIGSDTMSGPSRFAPVPKPGPCQPSPSQQRQASLDADTNPAMASPALSAATDGGSGDTVLGPASPVASMAGSSTNTGSQPSNGTSVRVVPPAPPQAQGRPLNSARYQDAPGVLQRQQQQVDMVQRQQPPADFMQRQQQQHQERLQQQQERAQHLAARGATSTQLSAVAHITSGHSQQQHLPQHVQQQLRPHTRVVTSPPVSPTRHSPAPPLLQPQPDASPSPQRQARMEALQRLKQQGSLRGGAGASRNGLPGPAQTQLALPQSAADGTVARLLPGAHGPETQRERDCPEASGKPQGPLCPSSAATEADQTEPDLAPSSEPKLSPRGFRARRQGWQEDSGGADEEADGARLQQQQPHLQGARDVEGQDRTHLLHREQQPRQKLPTEQQGPSHPDLSEEASLRTLHQVGGSAAPNHRRQVSQAQQPQPLVQQDSGTLTPRGWSHDARRPDVGSESEQRQLLPDRRAEAPLAQLPPGRYHREPDLVAAYPSTQDAACHRSGAARPVSAAAAEQAARSHGATTAAEGAAQARATLAGDEDSLALLEAHGRPREAPLQRQPMQRPADAADTYRAEAWPQASARANMPDSANRTAREQQKQGMGQAAGAGARGTAGDRARDAVEAGAAPHPWQQPAESELGSNGRATGAREGGAGGRGAEPAAGRLTTPCSGRMESAVDTKCGEVEVKGEVGGARAGVGGTPSADPRATVEASATAEKMSSILKYLEEVELQADQEATCAALAPALLATEPTTAAAVAAALLPGITHAHQRGGAGGGGRGRRYDTASAATTGTRQVTNSSRPGTAHTTTSQMGPQRSHAALSDAGTAHNRGAVGRLSQAGRRRATRSTTPEADDAFYPAVDDADCDDGEEDNGLDADDDAVSVATRSTAAGMTNRPAFLAESVYENVRAKIRRLQDDVKQKDARIIELAQEIESLQAAQRTSLLDADARLTEMLAAQRAEYEAAVSRHMAFVDRLLADKEALSGRAQQLAEQLKSADERQERAIAKLKEGWAAELKRQKEGWSAAEKQRREAWMQSKAAEIKDVTVKGLEGEVQKLLARHRAELSAAQQAAADEAKRHLDAYVTQNEAAVRQLKDRMSREAEEAVEKERAAAATRLREVSERYEQQLQTQRMRLVADADLRLEQLEQARKEDKKRYEEAVTAAKEAGDGRLKEAEEDWRREKDAVRRAHEKQMDALREQYETGQEGWRAAMAERARKEVSERVAAIREKLLQERNEEVQAVMTRLEAEHASAVEALKEDFRRREEAAANRAAAALKEARRAEAKMAERFRNAGVATKAAEDRLAASELTVSDLRRELEARNNTIRFLESQVSAAKDEAALRERDVRSLGDEKAAVAAEVAAAVARDKQQVEARLAQAIQEAQELRSRHTTEMAAVEGRVRATLARKDEVIAGLREQLAAMAAELRNTQEVLRQQQEELGSELDGAGGGVMGGGREAYPEFGGRRGGARY